MISVTQPSRVTHQWKTDYLATEPSYQTMEYWLPGYLAE
jgi:hypothetical protein